MSTGIGIGALLAASAASADAAARAYELVSPPGGIATIEESSGAVVGSTPDGNVVCYRSADAFAGAEPVGGTRMTDAYCARRSASGWTTEWVTQPRGMINAGNTAADGGAVRWLNADGSVFVFATDMHIAPGQPEPTHEDHPMDGFLRTGGATTWLTGPRAAGDTTDRPVAAVTADLRHLVYPGADGRAYEWYDGAVRLVSQDAAGDPAPPSSSPLALDNVSITSSAGTAVPSTITPDGAKIFFQAPGELVAGQGSATHQSVWVRENGAVTRLVSPRRGPVGTAVYDIEFAGASADGDIVYLRTAEQLTEDPKPVQTARAVYRYVVSADELRLVAASTSTTSTNAVRVLAVSRDGSTVVLYGGNLNLGDGQSLYIWRDGALTRVIGLQSSERASGRVVASSFHERRPLRVSDDGQVVVFDAFGDTPGIQGVYRWTVSGGLTVVSKDGSDAKVAAHSTGHADQYASPSARQMATGRTMTADAKTVFFDTEAALVPEDVNGVADVYEWRDGQISLVTPGTASGPSLYYDSSPDGSSVFFVSAARILPEWDTNTTTDLYVARAGGGFPPPAVSPVGSSPAAVGPAGAGAAPSSPTTQLGVADSATPETSPAAPPDASADTARTAPDGVTVKVRRSAGGARYRVRGAVEVDDRAACGEGRVRIWVLQRGRRVGSATTTLRDDCRFAGTVRIDRSALKTKGKLRVAVRFLGNESLRPKSSRTVRAAAGRAARREARR